MLNVILTPLCVEATFGSVDRTTEQSAPAPIATNTATPRNSAMGARISCL